MNKTTKTGICQVIIRIAILITFTLISVTAAFAQTADDGYNDYIHDDDFMPDDESYAWIASAETPVRKVVGLTILIDFPDRRAVVTRQQAEEFLNRKGGVGGINPAGSVRDYWLDVSNGRLDFSNIVTPIITMDKPFAYYSTGASGSKIPSDKRMELLTSAVSKLTEMKFDISEATTRFTGSGSKRREVFEMLNILLPGGGGGSGGGGSFSGITINGIGFNRFQVTTYTGSQPPNIGVFVHEVGHGLLSWPHLSPSDTTESRAYCIMNAAYRANPAPPNPYYKDLAGWIDVIDITGRNGIFTLTADSNTVYKFTRNENESYYIEARRRTGRSANIPGEGLIIWHVLKNADRKTMPLVKIINAGNPNSTDKPILGSSSSSFANAPFRADGGSRNTSFSRSSSPAARYHDRTLSGINITEISALGDTMTFRLTSPASSAITSVDISPPFIAMQRGTSRLLTATVKGNYPQQTVSWSVSGARSAGTAINNNGALTIARDESAQALTVTVTSAQDRSKSVAVQVYVGEGGTAENPYIITTPEQLIFLAAAVNSGNVSYNAAHYRLGNNITLSDSWTSIGTSSNPFRGTLDGNGKIISGITINATSNFQGLFGDISGGAVKNLGVEGVNISGGGRVGGIAGRIRDSSFISNCYSSGTITGIKGTASGSGERIGGIVGWIENGGGIENCYSTAEVSGSRYVGGILGTGLSVTTNTLKNSAALNIRVTSPADFGRMCSNGNSNTLANNIAFVNILNAEGTTTWSNRGVAARSGADITAAQIRADGTLGGRFTAANGWTTQNGRLPGFGATREIPAHLR